VRIISVRVCQCVCVRQRMWSVEAVGRGGVTATENQNEWRWGAAVADRRWWLSAGGDRGAPRGVASRTASEGVAVNFSLFQGLRTSQSPTTSASRRSCSALQPPRLLILPEWYSTRAYIHSYISLR